LPQYVFVAGFEIHQEIEGWCGRVHRLRHRPIDRPEFSQLPAERRNKFKAGKVLRLPQLYRRKHQFLWVDGLNRPQLVFLGGKTDFHPNFAFFPFRIDR
jgi:hypothetical protein